MTAYAATIRDYVIGDSQAWEWTKIPSLGPGEYRTQRVAIPGRHGTVPVGADYGGSRVVEFELEHMSAVPSLAEGAGFDLREAFAPAAGDELVEVELRMQSGTFTLRGRPLAATVEPVWGMFGCAVALAQFEQTDPLLYGPTRSVSVSVASMSGGLATPVDTTGGVTTTGSGSSGDTTVVNSGTAPTTWTAYINGPVTTPRLLLAGQTLELLGDVPAGATLVVDSYDGTIRLDGASRPWKSFESVWWDIPPGASTFSFRALAGTGSATLIWQDASF